MSSSSSQEINQEQQQEEMEWLESFLKRTFFGACSLHQNIQKNYLNRYCISCDVSACIYCIATDYHREHKLLKIYRHVYKDVVPLAEMETHIDCSKIQPFRCNKKMVISLNPLPHCGSGEADKDGSCDFCMRKLSDPKQFRFCSIGCKFPVTFSPGKTNEYECPFSEVQDDQEEDGESQRGKRHRRKGIPCRAPFF